MQRSLEKVNCKTVLTDRDTKVFNFLFEQKIASQDDIFTNFFANTSKKACIIRMQKLVRSKHLKKEGISNNGRLNIIYSLTDKSFSKIRESLILNGVQTKFKSDSYLHDLELTKFRLILEKFQMIESYYSENYLQCCYLGENTKNLVPYRSINSDAALKVKVNNGHFFVSLEYERSIKNRNRYAQKFLDYYLNSSITAVLYLCANKKVQNAITTIDKEVCQKYKPKIFTLNVESLPSKVENLPFTNLENGTFNLR